MHYNETALSLLHSGMAIDILSSDRADRCRSNFGSLILHECRSKSDFDQHLARLSKQLFLVYSDASARAFLG